MHGRTTGPVVSASSDPPVPSSKRAWELDEVVEVPVAGRLTQLRHGAIGVVVRAVDVERLAVMAERHIAAARFPVPEKRGALGEVGMWFEAQASRVGRRSEHDVPGQFPAPGRVAAGTTR